MRNDRNTTFGYWVRRRRLALDLTQAALANQVGCSESAIRKIEGDERRPSEQIAELLATVLVIPAEERTAFLRTARHAVGAPGSRLQSAASSITPPLVPREASASPANNLPPLPLPATPLIGRQVELQEVQRLLNQPACRLLTLVGPGGIGKTRLALAVADEQRNAYAGQVAFVPLAAVQSNAFLPQAIANAVGCPTTGQVNPTAQLLDYLRQRRMLIVLDTVEHLLTAVPSAAIDLITLLDQWLAQVPGVKWLITSRERLNIGGEWLFALQGLPLATLSASDRAVQPTGAVALFVDCAQRIQRDFTLTPPIYADVLRICQLVAGLPLGIELAAAWVHLLSCGEIAEEIERNLDFLARPARGRPDRHHTLAAVFEHSWRLLTPAEQRLLRHLAVFRGGFTRPLAATVSDATVPLLSALVDKSLLHRSAQGRYEQHEVIRQFAWRKLQEAGESEAAQDRHLLALRDQLVQADDIRFTPGQNASADAIMAEQANLSAALHWGLPTPTVAAPAQPGPRLLAAAELIALLSRFWYLAGNLAEGLFWLERALQLVPPPPPAADPPEWQRVYARLLFACGDVAGSMDDLTLARQHLTESLARFRTLQDKRQILLTIQRLAEVVGVHGAVADLDALLAEGLALARELNYQPMVAHTLAVIGDIAVERGEYERAEPLLAEALTIFRSLNRTGSIIYTLNLSGQLAIQRGNGQQAATLLLEALTLISASAAIHHFAEPWTLRNLALAQQIKGDYAAAITLYRRSLRSAEEQKLPAGIAHACEGLAEVAAASAAPLTAIQLWAGADHLRTTVNSAMSPSDRKRYEQILAQVRTQVDEQTFATTWRAGQALTSAAFIQFAMNFTL